MENTVKISMSYRNRSKITRNQEYKKIKKM